MSEDFKDLYNMLTSEREDIASSKAEFEKTVNELLGSIRSLMIPNIDLTKEFDLSTNFETFMIEDINTKHHLHVDAINYKIAVLQEYLQSLFTEKKFLEYRRSKEEEMTKEEYIEYISSLEDATNLIEKWYQEFMQK